MAALYSHTTRATGTTLTATIYNTDHQNHIDNGVPAQLDDYSSSLAQMQSTTDPYPAATESQATSLAGEFERIRYLIAQITGEAQWYIDPDVSLATAKTSLDAVSGARSPAHEDNVIANRMFLF